jgi:hypothetical protein
MMLQEKKVARKGKASGKPKETPAPAPPAKEGPRTGGFPVLLVE